ncbi:MAG: FAD-binding oxidoreductase [Deltaproteobacteria bacterium]|nr:FAD-binding oxidoreductase [Deltaproteobacteria bacterium]
MTFSLDLHREKVEAVAAQLRALAAAGGTAHVHKGGVHHFVPLPGDRRFRGRAVDVSALQAILEIDPVARLCTAEPGVPFGVLARATLAHGLLPTVVPELEGITVGGAVAGCSVESMSWREGGFHDSCTEYELVTGAGEVLTCTPQDDPLLFGMLHGSYGTLGVLTRATFRLVPARPYVRLEYRRYADAAEFREAVEERMAAGDFEFLDGIVHGPDRLVLCLGTFVDRAPYVSDYRGTRIFHRSTAARAEDYLSTIDYCFRYDTECHWMTATVPPLEWAPVRAAVGRWFLGSTNLIRWSKALEPLLELRRRRPEVVCDYFVPRRRWEELFAWYAGAIDHWPLWVVPYRMSAPYPWLTDGHAARMQDDLFFDCAVYGRRNDEPERDLSELLERKTYELGGIKTLISRNHHTPEAFWDVYDRGRYDAVKARLDPHGVFPGLYEKFHRG